LGFLDQFDNLNIMNALIGSMGFGGPPPMAAPQSTAPPPTPGASGQSTGALVNADLLANLSQGAPGVAGAPGTQSGPAPTGPISNAPFNPAGIAGAPGGPSGPTIAPPPTGLASTIGGAPFNAAGVPGLPGAQSGPAAAGPPAPPMPVPRPASMGPGAPQVGPVPGSPDAVSLASMGPGPAMSIKPSEIPGGAQGLLATIGRSSLFNMSPQQAAGLGAGLKAVAANWNKPALAAFAGSAGAAIEGQQQETDRQFAQRQQAAQQKFMQSSTAFKDMLAAQQENNMTAYREAQAKYLGARADALQTGAGGKGSNAWQNTPFGHVSLIEGDVLKYQDQQRKIATEQSKTSGQPIDEAAIAAKTEAYRQARYKAAGIDPAEADKIKNMGIQAPTLADGKTPNPAFNPFKNLTEDQIRTLPDKAWFVGSDGRAYQRDYSLRPPEGTAPGKQSSAESAPNYDDVTAMSGQG
jgi:hypothetical protein